MPSEQAIHESVTSAASFQCSPGTLILNGYLRREELARQFGLSTRTIDRWEALRIGPPRVHIGRTILYNVESVREWLLKRQTVVRPRQMGG
jgi:predicted DNA-binding transcriptional regulator AlpA